VSPQVAADVGPLHRGATADLADVAAALGVERREVLALEPGEDLALRVLERTPARRRALAGARGEGREVRGEIESALSEHFGQTVGLTLMVDTGASGVGEPAPAGGDQPDEPPSPSSGASASPGRARSTPRGPEPDDPGPAPVVTASDGEEPAETGDADESEGLSAFDESELGEVAEVDNSAQARVLQAFPGAEEVD